MRANDWSKISSVTTSRWIPLDYLSGVVRKLPVVGKVRVKVDGRSRSVLLPPVSEVPFLCPAPNWTDARRVATAYFNRLVGIVLPDSFPDEHVLALANQAVKPTLVALSSSVLVHPGPVRPKIAKRGHIFSMAILLIGDSGYPCFPVPVATGPAVESGYLDDEVAEVVLAVLSSTTRSFFI